MSRRVIIQLGALGMETTRILGSAPLKDAYRRVVERVAAAAERCGRCPGDVLIVAVTKNATPDQIRHLVELGHVDLGENRVQHLVQRTAQLEEFLSRHRTLRATSRTAEHIPDQVRWHMVGHLQRNKVKKVLPLVQLIHSVDSLRLAEELHSHAARMERTVDVLLQVNVVQELTKSGVTAPAALHLAEQIDTMVHLRLRGLMTMGPLTENPQESRSCFARTAEIFRDIRDAKIGGQQFSVLSMGMSNDFEMAIAEGANLVRVGRALFGQEQNG